MAEIRANGVSEEFIERIKRAMLDRKTKSIREATISAFEVWLGNPEASAKEIAKSDRSGAPAYLEIAGPRSTSSGSLSSAQRATLLEILDDITKSVAEAIELVHGGAGQGNSDRSRREAEGNQGARASARGGRKASGKR